MSRCLVLLLASLCALSAPAAVRLPAVFSDNAVLQRGMAVPVWGWADAGEAITVAFAGQQVAATADAGGRWSTTLAPLAASDAPRELTVTGKNVLVVRNVLVGEVWVCSGQSNMQFALSSAAGAREEIAQAADPALRMFTVTRATALEPQANCTGGWAVSHPATAGGFSAVGYYYARELRTALGVPVGMIHSAWGGTPIEAWLDRASLAGDPALAPLITRYDDALAHYDQQVYLQVAPALRAYLAQADAAKAAGRPVPAFPALAMPGGNPRNQSFLSSLYNGMIAPVVPYAAAGAIWYQGEANVGRARAYRTLLPALIQGWRAAWGQEHFAFLIVQLPNYQATRPQPSDSAWAELREAQARALQLPGVEMATTIDLGEANDIHPKNKRDVGIRLGKVAQATVYGKTLEYAGPRYAGMAVEGHTIRLRFTHAAGLAAAPGAALQGFAIAGADKHFVWAKAVIDGETVVVSSDQVPTPVAVRYAWADNPVCNLINAAALPAAPFRTDDWPGVTAGL